MTEHGQDRTFFFMPIPRHITLWMGSIEEDKFERRFILFPFLTALAVVTCAFITLSVLLWHIPGSADAVARLFATDMVHGYFPTAARANSYLAQKNGKPWEILLPAILAINMASCLIVTVFFSFWVLCYPFTILKDPSRNNSRLTALSCAAAKRGILLMLLAVAGAVFVVSIGLFGGDPSYDFRKAGDSLSLYILFQHLLIMSIPILLVSIAFLLKFRRTLKRLDVR